MEAAEAVCAGEEIAPVDVLPLLRCLVDKSLVVVESSGGRYRLLETLRHFGRAQLPARENAAMLSARHLAHYRAVAEQAAQVVHAGPEAIQLERIEPDYENIRQALSWALEVGEEQEGLSLAGSLGWYWWYRGYFGEGRRWLGSLLALPQAGARTQARERALYSQALLQFGAGWQAGRFWHGTVERRAQHEEGLAIAHEVGDEVTRARHLTYLGLAMGIVDYAGALARLDEALTLAAKIDDRWLVHVALAVLAAVAWANDDQPAAHNWVLQSLEQSQRDRDQNGYARALNFLASMTFAEGDSAAARRLLEESLAIARTLHDRFGTALVLGILGVVAAVQGDSAAAQACFEEKRALWEQVGERNGIAGALRDLGWLARRERALPEARAFYTDALGLERDLVDTIGIAVSLAGLGDVAYCNGNHAQASACYDQGLALLPEGDAWNERATCLDGLARVAFTTGDARRAAWLCGAAAARRRPDLTISPVTVAGSTEVMVAARTVLGEAAFAAAWAAGQDAEAEEQASTQP